MCVCMKCKYNVGINVVLVKYKCKYVCYECKYNMGYCSIVKYKCKYVCYHEI